MGKAEFRQKLKLVGWNFYQYHSMPKERLNDPENNKRKTDSKPYAEHCLFKNPGNIYLFNTRKYKVTIPLGLSAHKMYFVQCIFAIRAVSNLIRKTFLHMEWLEAIRLISWPSLRIASNQKVIIVGTILLQIWIGDDHIRVVFAMVKTWAEPVLQQISFIDRVV